MKARKTPGVTMGSFKKLFYCINDFTIQTNARIKCKMENKKTQIGNLMKFSELIFLFAKRLLKQTVSSVPSVFNTRHNNRK